MKIIDFCEVCGSQNLDTVLDLGLHPLCDDLVAMDQDRVCDEYPIEILFCESCQTAHQKYQLEKEKLFTPEYHYRARMTGSVLAGMKELVDSCELHLSSLSGLKVLDVGCNDGSLLDYFKERGCKTIGVEPTAAGLESRHETINRFFDISVAEDLVTSFGQFDIVVFTNVFAHIDDLKSLLANVDKVLKRDGTLVIENHYLGAVIKYGQFDTFYHEHPRTYSVNSFRFIAESLGRCLTKIEFVSRYGGNIRVFISNNPEIEVESVDEDFAPGFRRMDASVHEWIACKRYEINRLVEEYGPLRAKAFPGRAAILVKLLGLTEKHIQAVYEISGSIKVNHFIPGSRIPILPEKELYSKENQFLPILNLAWHIPREVVQNLKKNGYEGEVLHIKDFVAMSG